MEKNLTHMVRQTILKQFEEYSFAFQKYFCREEGIALWDSVVELEGTSGYLHRKKKLVDHLQRAGIACSIRSTDQELKLAVEKLPTCSDMEQELVRMLYGIYKKALTPAEYMERLVRRLGNPEFQTGSVRLAIVKQFLLNTTYHTGVVAGMIEEKTGQKPEGPKELAEAADESLFEVLDHKLTKDEKNKYALLKLADDLATGRFRSNGGTKTALYMFAFAFDMTTYIDPETDSFDPDRDIERNLFFDYYANSLLRYISEDYNSRATDYESEPLGDGINYKNYAEIIYLYYLNRRDLTPAKRLRRANNLIAECSRYAAEHRAEVSKQLGNTVRYTYLYKDLYLLTIKQMAEEDLVPYICGNFEIGEANSSAARIAVASDNKTAGFHLLKLLKEGMGGGRTHLGRMEARIYKDTIKELTAGYEEDFVRLLEKMGQMLFGKPEAEGLVTRSQLMAVYYQKFLDDPSLAGVSLIELSDEFAATVNPVLEDSRFQTFSDKNVFDIFIVILLYRNLNVL